MTGDGMPDPRRNVEQIFASPGSTPISDELGKLTAMLEGLFPRESLIKFDFDGKLRVHVDVRRFEEMTTVEALLPSICGGIFHDIQRGIAENHSFFHRVTALVGR